MTDLVCLHAAASGPGTWAELTPRLAELGYRVHCPTLPGHRGAPRRSAYPLTAFRDAVLAELDRLALERVVLVGHSLGAFTASMVAASQPDRVTRLVLEEPPVPRRNLQDAPPARQQRAGFAMRALAFLGRGRFDPRMLRDVVAGLREPQEAWWAGLPSITAPALILAGGETSHLDQSRYGLLAQALPDAVVTTLDAGHRIHRRAPEKWLAEVAGFLA
ncbi:alpha/beta fold hydrolase [Amycolatopsis sp. WQ 127309]|uniref:alpha/beta fold hydrolase n=1 Tax=Amycolatopsis sp. WQ 127309 TaxID=2932773 RepID=UPI001FF1570C|nr:alpha/beta fold hydrolase [Amycolatopsis sp. WQ 127309]UOZ06243.1 alpha/beta hydrolase [Amycolatopsis sp. WQ 127309]